MQLLNLLFELHALAGNLLFDGFHAPLVRFHAPLVGFHAPLVGFHPLAHLGAKVAKLLRQ